MTAGCQVARLAALDFEDEDIAARFRDTIAATRVDPRIGEEADLATLVSLCDAKGLATSGIEAMIGRAFRATRKRLVHAAGREIGAGAPDLRRWSLLAERGPA